MAKSKYTVKIGDSVLINGRSHIVISQKQYLALPPCKSSMRNYCTISAAKSHKHLVVK